MCLPYKSFENNVERGEIARHEQLSFSSVFSTRIEIVLLFSSNLKSSSAKYFSLKESEICRLGKSQNIGTERGS